MRPLSAAALLEAWERGQGRGPVEQVLLLIGAASPDASCEALARLPLGQRDRLLLTLRAWTFGARFDSAATCPACADQVELSFTTDDISTASGEAPPETSTLSVDGFEVRFRLPNSLDLVRAEGLDPAAGRRMLLQHCVLEARHGDRAVAVDEAPEAVLSAVAAHMAQADPQADVQLALSCAACGHRWEVAFDVGSYFCREVQDWAPRALREVHVLASAYGWHEAEILAMSAWRRQAYLAMLGR